MKEKHSSIDNKYVYKQFINRENQSFHEEMEREQIFYAAVKSGNCTLVQSLLDEHNLEQKTELGKLSKSCLQSHKYHFAISAALIARHCIEGGMSREDAFNLSDLYINEVDLIQNTSEIDLLLREMFVTYTKKMQTNTTSSSITKEIHRCITYIYEHLHERITTEILADYIGINRSHLSRAFKMQTGQCLNNYIMNTKLETAKNMLLYSEYDIPMISEILAFSSQSYFTSVFKKKYWETPKLYRDNHYKSVYG